MGNNLETVHHWHHVLFCWHNTKRAMIPIFYISWECAYTMLGKLYMQHWFRGSLLLLCFSSGAECPSLIWRYLKDLFSKSKISYWPNFSPCICQNWYALIWAICLLIFALQQKYCQKSVQHWRNYCPYVIILHAHTRQHHESLQVAWQESKVERHKCHMRKFSTLDGFTLVCTDCVMGGVRWGAKKDNGE